VVVPDCPHKVGAACHVGVFRAPHFFATFAVKFPALAFKFPDLRNIFPVKLHRELSDKSLWHSGFFSPKSSPDASKSENSLLNSLIAGKSRGDGRDQHCVASQALPQTGCLPCFIEKSPQFAAFFAFRESLWVAKSALAALKFSKVSGHRPRNSRSRETAGGDTVRSPLPGAGGSGSGRCL
jgi:hypothetical protein